MKRGLSDWYRRWCSRIRRIVLFAGFQEHAALDPFLGVLDVVLKSREGMGERTGYSFEVC